MSVVCSGAQTVAVKRLYIGGEEKKGERTREEKKHTTYTTQHTPKDERGETKCMCPNTHAPLPFKAETVAQLSLTHLDIHFYLPHFLLLLVSSYIATIIPFVSFFVTMTTTIHLYHL